MAAVDPQHKVCCWGFICSDHRCECAAASIHAITPHAVSLCTLLMQAKQTLNCMAVSHDVELVATGYAHAAITIHDLTSLPRAAAPPVATAAAAVAAGGSGGGFSAADAAAAAAGVGGSAGGAGAPPPATDDLSLDAETSAKHLYGHAGPVYGLDFSCDKKALYSAGADGSVRLWVTDLGANAVLWEGHNAPAWCVAACPMGHWVASGGADWVCRLWCALSIAVIACAVVRRTCTLRNVSFCAVSKQKSRSPFRNVIK